MFSDPRARRAWQLYFLKVEAVLSPVAPSIRRELIGDLKAHVRDVLANEHLERDEAARLTTALDRVGDPKEFLAPLLTDAVFRTPPRHGSIAMTVSALALYAGRGAACLARALGLVSAASVGLAVIVVALNSVIRPDRAGLFFVEPDTYQLRILGVTHGAGVPLLTSWMAIGLVAAGAALIWWTLLRTRRILMELIAASA